MDHKSGWKIVERCFIEGDSSAWEAFVERFDRALRWGIGRVLGHFGDGRGGSAIPAREDSARDVLQECYFKLLSDDRRILGLCRERDDKALNAYFARLGERCARDFVRSRGAQKRGYDCQVSLADLREELIPTRVAESPEAGALLKEARAELLQRCRKAAGRKQRERNYRILVMAFLEGLTSKEISERLAGRVSHTSIDSLVYRARQRLERSDGTGFVYRRAVA